MGKVPGGHEEARGEDWDAVEVFGALALLDLVHDEEGNVAGGFAEYYGGVVSADPDTNTLDIVICGVGRTYPLDEVLRAAEIIREAQSNHPDNEA